MPLAAPMHADGHNNDCSSFVVRVLQEIDGVNLDCRPPSANGTIWSPPSIRCVEDHVVSVRTAARMASHDALVAMSIIFVSNARKHPP